MNNVFRQRNYADLDLKLLWGLAAARCAYPGCRTLCIKERSATDRPSARRGRVAHIVAHSDTGPRSNPGFPRDKRNKYENLILLCATHHDDIDAQESTFTIDILHQWKTDHEGWVQTSLAQQMPRVSFAELEIVCRGITHHSQKPDDSFRITGIEEKMSKNGLTENVRFLLDMGCAKVPEVQRFVSHIGALDPLFPDRLVGGFKSEYNRLSSTGLYGDGLFLDLQQFASPDKGDFLHSAAGLAVLSYLFATCEVFQA